VSGTVDRCLEHVTQTLSSNLEALSRAGPSVLSRRREPVVDPLHDRRAGLDVSKKDVKACVRSPGTRANQRHCQVRTFATTTNPLLELRGWLVEQRVTLVAMEATGDIAATVLPARRRLERLGQPRAREGATGPQIRCQRFDVAGTAGRVRATEGVVRAPSTDPPAAGPDPLPDHAVPGAHPRRRPAGEGAGRLRASRSPPLPPTSWACPAGRCSRR